MCGRYTHLYTWAQIHELYRLATWPPMELDLNYNVAPTRPVPRTIITMPPNSLMVDIHNVRQRMPAILAREDTEAWLAGSTQEAHAALKPYPADSMLAWPVSRRVNTPKNNHASLIEHEPQAPMTSPVVDTGAEQRSLDLTLLDPGEPIVE
jgi:putative SOS response-associated peptidase YedK